MSKYDSEKYREFYQKNKERIAERRKLLRKVKPKKKAVRLRRREWWANMSPEQKEIALQKRRDHYKKYKVENAELIKEKNRLQDQKKKERKLRKHMTQLKYERAHPGRMNGYYQENKAKVLARQKKQRQDKKLAKATSA